MFEEKVVQQQLQCPFRVTGVVGYLTAAGLSRCRSCGEIHPVILGSETPIIPEPKRVADGRGR